MGTSRALPEGGDGCPSVLVLGISNDSRVAAAVRGLQHRYPPGTNVVVAVPGVGADRFDDLGPNVTVWSIGLQELSLDEPRVRSEITARRFAEIVIPVGFPCRALLHVDRFIRDHPSVPVRVESPIGRTSNRPLSRLVTHVLTFAVFLPYGVALRVAHVADAIALLTATCLAHWAPRRRGEGPPRSVTHVIASLGTGGAQRQLVEYLRRASESGRDVGVVSVLAGDRAFVNRLRELPVELEILSSRDEQATVDGPWWTTAFPHTTTLFRVAARLRRRSTDCVVGWLFPTTMIAAAAGRMAGCARVVATDRNMSRWKREPPYGRWWYRRLDRLGVRLVDTMVVNSDRTAEDFQRWAVCPKERITVVHNGADEAELHGRAHVDVRAELGIAEDETLLLNVGRLSYEKNHEELVRMAGRLKTRRLTCRTVIVGHGDLGPRLERLSEHLGVAREVLFTGRRDDPQSFYRHADLFVLPSLFEGLPNVVLEAQVFGLPVVAYDVGGNAEIVANGRTGFVVSPGDEDRFEDAVVRLITDPELRRRMGEAGRERVRTEFSVEKMVAGIDAACGLRPISD